MGIFIITVILLIGCVFKIAYKLNNNFCLSDESLKNAERKFGSED